jgi:hypothetical protein
MPVQSIQVGSACQENSSIYISNDLERIGAVAKCKIDGAIGFEFLRNFRTTIDYRKNKVRFATSADPRQEAIGSTASLPFTITPAEAWILVQVTANGHGPFHFILDTAAGRTTLAPELIEQCGVSLDKEVAAMGAGGKLTTRQVNLESFCIGDATIENLAAIVGQFHDALGTAAGAKVHGIIGNDVLSRFLVTLDCPNRRLILDKV